MDSEPLDLLTDEVLRDAIGAEIVDRAYLNLAKNKVVQRTRFSGNEIFARWDFLPGSAEMRVGFQDEMLLTLCTCHTFSQEGMCMHIAGLLTAWASQRESFIPRPDEEMGPGQAPSRGSIAQPAPAGQVFDVVDNFRQILNMFTVGDLRDMARRRSVPISGIRKVPIVESLARAFSQRDKFWQDWRLLSPPARLMAGLLPFLISYINPATLEQAAQPLGLKGKVFTDALEELRASGWIAIENYGAVHFPAVLPVWTPPDADFTQVPVMVIRSQRVQIARAPQSFTQDVTRLLVLIQAAPEVYQARVDARLKDMWKKVPMLQDWPVETHDLERATSDPKPYQYVLEHGLHIAPTPSPVTNETRQKLTTAMQTEPEEIDFILRLLHSLKLIQWKSGKPLRAVPDAIMIVLQSGALQFARQLNAIYADLQGWSEIDLGLARSNDFRLVLRNYNQGNYDLFVRNLSMLRQRLILLIRRLPAGQWYTVKDVALRASVFPFYSLLRGAAGFGYFEINGKKVNADRLEDGHELLARILEAMLSGPLYWQGMVDLAWEKERIAGFRLTELASALLVHPVEFEMPKSQQGLAGLAFTGDGSLLLRLETASGNLIGLATLLGDVNAGSEGGVLVRPTLLGAGRAFEAGWSVERILEMLSSEAGQAPPAALASLLRKWWQDFGRVQIYQDVAMMEFNDDYALNELLAGTTLSRHLLYRFSPRLIAIRPEGVEELRNELVKKGYTPKTIA